MNRLSVKTLQQQMGFANDKEILPNGSKCNGIPEGVSLEPTKVPDRLMNQNKKIPVAVMYVDLDKQEVWVRFCDNETIGKRIAMEDSVRKFCESSDAENYLISPEQVADDEVVIVKDSSDNYHRTRIPTGSRNYLSSLIDLDGRVAGLKFESGDGKIYRIPAENKHLMLWHQAVRCKVALGKPESMTRTLWLQHNEFIFKNRQWIETCLLVALECSRCQVYIDVSNITREEGEITIYIDIFQTDKFMEGFFSAFRFRTIPRLPSVGREKVAVITNVQQQGLINVVMYDYVFNCLREVLKKLYSEKDNLFANAVAVDLAIFYREMIDGLQVKKFLALLPGENTQLHRVHVLGIEFQKDVRVLYIDIGKEMIVPLEYLVIPYEQCNNKNVPQMLELISPQAVTLVLNGFNDTTGIDRSILFGIRKSLEFKPCFLKVVFNSSFYNKHPIAVVRTDILPSEVVSVMDYVHSQAILYTGRLADETVLVNENNLKCLKNVATRLAFNNNY
ncbi:hypothetical protein Ocin01_11548 [Orchesella cincta]|uniref:Tudor domain-containing protein n=1 Tax=Orchesella cincta TaxID=48709 RepID=A0A1D2MQF5_ORCCI|nr:hypothetical protein Ocin01_11548 [Orchesella cincta]